MAKVQYGPIVSDARNKQGGSVYSKARPGSYVRTKVSPVQPRTDAQRGVRASFTTISKLWPTISDAQREGWIAIAARYPYHDVFGNTRVLTGLQMFQKCNRVIMDCGYSPISDAPPNLNVGSFGTLSVAYTPGATPVIECTLGDPGSIGGDDKWTYWATPPLSKGRAFVTGLLRRLGAESPGVGGPFDIGPTYKGRFGNPAAGLKIHILASLSRRTTGAVSVGVQTTVLTT